MQGTCIEVKSKQTKNTAIQIDFLMVFVMIMMVVMIVMSNVSMLS